MASGVYNNFKFELMNASYNMANGGDSHKVALMTNSHAFTATNDVWTDVSANEISGTGYTAGGQVLANQATSVDDGDNEGVYDADNAQWTSASFSAYHAVLYNDTHATDDLVLSIDFGGIQTVTTGTFTINWDTEGILNIG